MTISGIFSLILSNISKIAPVSILYIIFCSIPIATGLIAKNIFDGIGELSMDVPYIWILCGALFITEILGAALGWLWLYFHYTLERFLGDSVRVNFLKYFLSNPSGNEKYESGDILSRLEIDVREATSPILDTYQFIGEGILAISAIVILIRVDPFLTAATSIPMILIVIIMQYLSKLLQRYRLMSRHTSGQVNGFISNIFSSAIIIKSMGIEDNVADRFNLLNQKRYAASSKDIVLGEMIGSLNINLGSFSRALILLLAVNYINNGSFSVGDFVLFALYLDQVMFFPRRFGAWIANRTTAKVSFNRLEEMMPSETIFKPVGEFDIESADVNKYNSEILRTLRIENFTYQLDSSDKTKNRISFDVNSGEMIVITGRVGSGKSTILKLIVGILKECEGSLYWNNQKINSRASYLVSPRCVYIQQHSRIFNQSIRENIDPENCFTDEQVERAIRIACLDNDLLNNHLNLEASVGPKGIKLSGGQLSRVSLARAVIRSPQLLILDDITSALDFETERQILANIASLKITCLIASHRRSVLEQAARIIVIDNGKVVGVGVAKDLLESCSEFSALWHGDNVN